MRKASICTVLSHWSWHEEMIQCQGTACTSGDGCLGKFCILRSLRQFFFLIVALDLICVPKVVSTMYFVLIDVLLIKSFKC